MRYLCLLAVLFLAACATRPVLKSQGDAMAYSQHLASLDTITNFAIKGRMGVISDYKGFSGGLSWQHQAKTEQFEESDQMDIYTPLGSKAASIEKTPQQVVLTSADGKTLQAQDAESLTEQTMGWRLPLSGLGDWALGRPTSSTVDAVTWDENGYLTSLDQDGWHIEYQNYTAHNNTALPSKVTLKTDKVRLKLLIEDWRINATD
jgi:outer membrane lipoprotein LolB